MTANRAAVPVRRGTFLAASAALIAAPATVRAQTPAQLRIGATVAQDILGVLWAQQSGIFQKYGLDVEVEKSNNGTAVSAAVLSGSLELGKSGVLALLTAHAHGLPIVLEAPSAVYDSSFPNVALVVAKDSPIKSGRDLTGKTVAVAALGDLFTLGNMAWIDKNGGDSRSVKFIELPGSAQADAVAAGRVDAAALADPLTTQALDSGKCRFLAHPFDAIAKRFAATLFFASRDYATKNPDVMARFRKAIAEGTAQADAHRAQALPLLAKYTGIDLATLASAKPNFNGATLDVRLIQPLIDVALKYGVLKTGFPAKEMFDPAL